MAKRPIIYFIGGLLLVIAFLFGLFKSPENKYDRTIGGDMKSYYAYLPAFFIYQDLDYKFVEDYEQKYYPEDGSHFKEFRLKTDQGEIVNKTFPGLSLLILPFFLIAHFLSFIFGMEPDGYSSIYQYSIIASIWFYFSIGIFLTYRFLAHLKFSKSQIFVSIFAIVFGTNMIYYLVFDFSVSHVYNFFLVTLFLRSFQLYFSKHHTKHFIVGLVAICLLVIIRPTNLLVFALLPLAHTDPKQFLADILTTLKSRKLILWSLVAGGLIALFPIAIWYAHSGQFFVYSYGEEGFDFSNPHWASFMFSYQKGWLLYSPLIILALTGCWFWYKKSKFQVLVALGFLGLMTYIYSSWWAWHFGGGMGERVMIDYSLVYMLALCYLLTALKGKVLKYTLFSVMGFLCFLSVAQSWQTYRGILPGAKVTSSIYWNNFLSFRKKASFELPTDAQKIWSEHFDFETTNGLSNHWVITNQLASSGKHSAFVGKNTEYGISYKRKLDLSSDSSFILVSFAMHETIESKGTKLVVSLIDSTQQNIHYKSFELKPYSHTGEWVDMEFGAFLPEKAINNTTLKVYFWDPLTLDEVYIDDLNVSYYEVKSNL